MATERQIEAIRRDVASSNGVLDVHAGLSPEFVERRAKWGVEYQPVGESANWAMDRAVAASLRIERCEHAVDRLCSASAKRAALSWDEDRAVEAATVFGRLARKPVMASRQLQTTLAGVGLLINAWQGLAAALETGEDWSDVLASIALDLLGVDPVLRSGRTLIDAPDGVDSLHHRRDLASDELARLEALRDEALAPLDLAERRHSMSGDSALLSQTAKLLLRYERDAWARYNQAMKEVKAPPAPSPVASPPPRAVAPPPAPSPSPTRTGADGRRSYAATLKEIEARGGLRAVVAEVEAAFPRSTPGSGQPLLTDRTQFVAATTGSRS